MVLTFDFFVTAVTNRHGCCD